MRFFTFVLKNVLRRRVRSSLTVLGMAIAVAAVVSLFGISQGLKRSWLSIYENQKAALIITQKGTKQNLTSLLPEKLGEKIAELPGVVSVNTGIVDLISLGSSGTGGVLLDAWTADSPNVKSLEVTPGGRHIEEGDTRSAMIGTWLADSLGKGVGDTVEIYGVDFRIVGIYKSANTMINGGIVAPLHEIQKVKGEPGKVTGFTVVVTDMADKNLVEKVRKEIDALSPYISAIPSEEFVNSTTEMTFLGVVAWVTSAVALVIGAVGILNTMIMSVYERTKEIGILRAIGWRRWLIVRMILVESLLLSVAGGVVGTLIAVVLTRVVSKMPAVSGMVEAELAPWVIFLGLGIALVVGVLGAAYPAYRGAQMLPTEALRHE
jgi:putative ABC transport system permease protein